MGPFDIEQMEVRDICNFSLMNELKFYFLLILKKYKKRYSVK